ncbi:hypothetical protein L6452_31609 [Arctium lappa]|uniref:Uncharacterized protein n=1 Tax=Arctium lappa TaxID=4217 RepID=A0ACB8Z1I3_ARCLA|nr:hypothetical protein L6452_31609 [Arctium lappa]
MPFLYFAIPIQILHRLALLWRSPRLQSFPSTTAILNTKVISSGGETLDEESKWKQEETQQRGQRCGSGKLLDWDETVVHQGQRLRLQFVTGCGYRADYILVVVRGDEVEAGFRAVEWWTTTCFAFCLKRCVEFLSSTVGSLALAAIDSQNLVVVIANFLSTKGIENVILDGF